MSKWTHVNAVIRFDGIKGQDPDPDLGNTVSFDDENEEMWDACNVPCGSEGSLEYKLIEVGDGITRFTAVIWGDLRDYDESDKIVKYLEHITQGHMIRSGIAEINMESGDRTEIYHYENEGWKCIDQTVYASKDKEEQNS